MDISDFQTQLKKRSDELSQYLNRKLPVKAGAKVKSIVQENFRLGGFQDGSLEKWQETKRQRLGSGADSRRGPLLSSRNVLYSSTGYRAGNAAVTIYNNVPYAGIHNYGGTTHPRVTSKMRKYAWARYYQEINGKNDKDKDSGESSFWKGIALTRKQTLDIKIPKRQFIGPSKTVDEAIQSIIKNDLNAIISK